MKGFSKERISRIKIPDYRRKEFREFPCQPAKDKRIFTLIGGFKLNRECVLHNFIRKVILSPLTVSQNANQRCRW